MTVALIQAVAAIVVTIGWLADAIWSHETRRTLKRLVCLLFGHAWVGNRPVLLEAGMRHDLCVRCGDLAGPEDEVWLRKRR